jgi:hypothetical protein
LPPVSEAFFSRQSYLLLPPPFSKEEDEVGAHEQESRFMGSRNQTLTLGTAWLASGNPPIDQTRLPTTMRLNKAQVHRRLRFRSGSNSPASAVSWAGGLVRSRPIRGGFRCLPGLFFGKVAFPSLGEGCWRLKNAITPLKGGSAFCQGVGNNPIRGRFAPKQ